MLPNLFLMRTLSPQNLSKVKQKNRCLIVTIQSFIVNQKQFLGIKFEGYWDVVMISYKDIFVAALANLEKLKALGI